MIKEICSVSGAIVDIDDDGTVKISSNSSESISKAVAMINDIIFEPEIGDIYEGQLLRLLMLVLLLVSLTIEMALFIFQN